MNPGSAHALVTDMPTGSISDRGLLATLHTWVTTGPPVIWQEAFRALKPGANVAISCSPVEYDLLAVAIRLAGFHVRDSIHVLMARYHRSLLLARKPLDGAVAENVRKHSAGGINVEAARIRGGRWPPNLVIVHPDECRRAGTKNVKATSLASSVGKGSGDTSKVFGQAVAMITTGYSNDDGTETIEAWECVEGCPAAALDRQTGVLVSGKPAGKRASRKGFSGNVCIGTDLTGYGDSGGASRFFPQVHGETELRIWIERLVVPRGGVVLDPMK